MTTIVTSNIIPQYESMPPNATNDGFTVCGTCLIIYPGIPIRRYNVPLTIDGQTYYRTTEVCRMIGISRNNLFSWCKKGTVIKVEHMDHRGWRLFIQAQVDAMKKKTKQVSSIYLEHLVEVSSSAGHSCEPTSTA